MTFFLIVNFGFTLSRSEGTLTCSGLWTGDMGVSGPQPLSYMGAWPGAGLFRFPGLAGEGGSLSRHLHPFPLASAESRRGSCWGLGTLICARLHGEFPGQVSCVPRAVGMGTT